MQLGNLVGQTKSAVTTHHGWLWQNLNGLMFWLEQWDVMMTVGWVFDECRIGMTGAVLVPVSSLTQSQSIGWAFRQMHVAMEHVEREGWFFFFLLRTLASQWILEALWQWWGQSWQRGIERGLEWPMSSVSVLWTVVILFILMHMLVKLINSFNPIGKRWHGAQSSWAGVTGDGAMGTLLLLEDTVDCPQLDSFCWQAAKHSWSLHAFRRLCPSSCVPCHGVNGGFVMTWSTWIQGDCWQRW